jgi:hypothetical protein
MCFTRGDVGVVLLVRVGYQFLLIGAASSSEVRLSGMVESEVALVN